MNLFLNFNEHSEPSKKCFKTWLYGPLHNWQALFNRLGNWFWQFYKITFQKKYFHSNNNHSNNNTIVKKLPRDSLGESVLIKNSNFVRFRTIIFICFSVCLWYWHKLTYDDIQIPGKLKKTSKKLNKLPLLKN